MRLVVDKFEVLTDKKIPRSIKIVLISDIHAGDSPIFSGKFNMNSTLRGLKKIRKIDGFALCGDFVNNAKSWLNPYVMKNFINFVEKAATIAPVFLVRGNHDIYMASKRTEEKYQELGKIKNVFLIDNKQIDLFGIKITGFSPRHETYDLVKHGRKSQYVATEDFKNASFEFEKEEFNLIFTHSPYSLMNKTAMEALPDFFEKCDVVLSGHLHNGLMSSGNIEKVQNRINKADPVSKIKKFVIKNIDAGIWFSPKTGFMVSHCRGAKKVSEEKIERVFLPSSKKYTRIFLSKNERKFIQITGKGINKYPVFPLIEGRPSVVELKISPRK